MDVEFSKPWGDAATKHLVAKIKALSFSFLSKITQSRDPHLRGQGGSLPTSPAIGVTEPCWDTQGNCYSLECYREHREMNPSG